MAQYIGQLSGSFLPYTELTKRINSGNFDKIIKLGIQIDHSCEIKINNQNIQVSPINRVEYEGVAVTSLVPYNKNGSTSQSIPLIVDYIYELAE